jgi:hypothetical protein
MLRSIRVRQNIFLLLETALSVAALYHGVGLFYKIDSSPVLRHALFAGLDLFCVYGFLKGRTYFVFFFTAFTVQQYYTHGKYLIEMWINQREIHWISVFVLVLLPVGLICLIADVLQSSVDGIFTNPNVQ